MVVAPHGSAVEVQHVLFFATIVQTVIHPLNPVEVLWIFLQRPLELQVPLLGVVLFAPAIEVSCTTDLELFVG